jgi:septal ring factor EnvC (AmiA/AmiB activator)
MVMRIFFIPILCVCVFCCVVSGPAYGQGEETLDRRIKSQEKELKKIQDEIEQHRAKSSELAQKASGISRRLASLDKEIELSEKFIGELENREALLTEQIDSLRTRVGLEKGALAAQNDQLMRRLRKLYMREPHFSWEILLGSENIHEMLQKYKYLKLIAEWDAKLLREVRERKTGLEHEQAMLTETLADIAALKQTKTRESDQLKRSKKDRLAMLGEIKSEKSRSEKAIKELEEAQSELKNLISVLEKKRLDEMSHLPDMGDFSALKGRLVRPVNGKIVRAFGKNRHPRFGTVTFNSGVDIQASPGAPIRAVATGVVHHPQSWRWVLYALCSPGQHLRGQGREDHGRRRDRGGGRQWLVGRIRMSFRDTQIERGAESDGVVCGVKWVAD